MTKKHTAYTIISLCAVFCYCVFLVKNAITNVNTTDETTPYVAPSEFFSSAEEVLDVSLTAPDVKEKDFSLPTEAVKVAKAEEETSEKASEKAGFSPIWPLKGEIITPFSLRHAYSKETGDWRAHGAIDILCEKNESVLAVEDGAVRLIYESPLWGSVIEVDHGEYVSIYKSLSTLKVREGDSVLKGDVIAEVGNTTYESSLPTHLHFEMTHYGESIDPCELLG